jgi:cellulose biosynthesis protein BcsQ
MGILAVASSKGGVGKTLVSQILFARLAAEGCRVGVLDADPNQALSGWLADVYEGPPPARVARPGWRMRSLPSLPSVKS